MLGQDTTFSKADSLFQPTLIKNNKIFCTEYGRLHLADLENSSADESSPLGNHRMTSESNYSKALKKPFLFQKVTSRKKQLEKIDKEFKKYDHMKLQTINQFKQVRKEIQKTDDIEDRTKRIMSCSYKKTFLTLGNLNSTIPQETKRPSLNGSNLYNTSGSKKDASPPTKQNNFFDAPNGASGRAINPNKSNTSTRPPAQPTPNRKNSATPSHPGTQSPNPKFNFFPAPKPRPPAPPPRPHSQTQKRAHTTDPPRLRTHTSFYDEEQPSIDGKDLQAPKNLPKDPLRLNGFQRQNKEIQMMFSKIKRCVDYHNDWSEKDKTLQSLMSKTVDKVHNRGFEDFERRGVIASMRETAVTIDRHIDERFLGVKRKLERSREKHRRLYEESWSRVNADRKISIRTNFGGQHWDSEPWNMTGGGDTAGLEMSGLTLLKARNRGGTHKFLSQINPERKKMIY